MKKHLANILSGSRVILCIPILVTPRSSAWFYVLYIFCGLTDIFDGMIARKTGTASKFGARLDTFADFVFILICAIKILPILHIPAWLWMWIIIIGLIKIYIVALHFIRKKKLVSIHSILNKITGFALFLLPLTLSSIEPTYSVATICILATVAVMQEAHFVANGQEIL